MKCLFLCTSLPISLNMGTGELSVNKWENKLRVPITKSNCDICFVCAVTLCPILIEPLGGGIYFSGYWNNIDICTLFLFIYTLSVGSSLAEIIQYMLVIIKKIK